jgi:hypothetical protein
MAVRRARSPISVWGFIFYLILVALLLMLAIPEWRSHLLEWCYHTAEYWDSAIRGFIGQDTIKNRW